MGRGVMVHPQAEATVYRHLNNYHSTCAECGADNCECEADCPECGADMYDMTGEVARDEIEYLIDSVQRAFCERFPSMSTCDRWASGGGAMDELHCIAENGLCEVYISEYCGVCAISVVPLDTEWHSVDVFGLAVHWCATYASDELITFGQYDRIGSMSNGESVYGRVS